MVFKLESKAFSGNQLIPVKYTCDGENLSPPLNWTNHPKGTKSFVLIMDDPDAPHGIWNHWIIYNLPSEISQLEEGVKPNELPELSILAENSWHQKNYRGPCPPLFDKEHHYHFKLYALKDLIRLGENVASKASIENAIEHLLLGKSVLIGRYARLSKTMEKDVKHDIKDALTIISKKNVDPKIKEKAKNEVTKDALR